MSSTSCVMISGNGLSQGRRYGVAWSIFEALPPELSAHVFSFLTPSELSISSTVCHLFLHISHDNDLWKRWGVDEFVEWPNVESFRQLFHFLFATQSFFGIWRADSGRSKGGVLLVGLEKGRLEGKALLVYPSGEVDLYPVLHITPASPPSKMKIVACPTNPHDIARKEGTQPNWKEGRIIKDKDNNETMRFYSEGWKMQYARVPGYEKSEHGAASLQGLWTSKYGAHGWEVMSVSLNDDTLTALKVIGDPNVPAGECSWDAEVDELAGVNIRTKQEASVFECAGRGQISPVGFTSPQWVPGLLAVRSVNKVTFHWTVLSSTNVYERIDISSVNIPERYLIA